MKTIKFSDGYTVEINERGTVTRSHQGKVCSAHASHWKPVPLDGNAADYIRKAGNRIEDYLFSEVPNPAIIRATNGVREAVAEATEQGKRENAEREAKFKAEREALLASELAKCGLKDPVQVSVSYFDGYVNHITVGDREFRNPDWKQVYCGQFNFIERTELDRLNKAFDDAEKARADREAAEKAARDQEFQTKLAEAKSTGKAVALARWTTDRCMNGHSRECSFDNATRSVYPDGTIKTHYSCCY